MIERKRHDRPRRFGALVTSVVFALAVSGCASSPPDLTDPGEILDRAVAQIDGASSLRLELEVSGAVAIDLFGSGSPRPMLLQGTTLTADLDIAGGRMKATFAAPALLGLSGEFLAPGGRAYLRTSLTGPKYLPLDVPDAVPGGSPDGTPASSPGPLSLAGLTALLDDPSITATKLDDADCGGARCYQVRVEVDPTRLDLGLPDLGALSGVLGLFGSPDGSPVPGVTPAAPPSIEPIVIVVTLAKDTLRPVTLASDVTMGDTATLELVLAFSAWGEAVTVAPPPADQVGDQIAPGGLPFPFPAP